MRSRPRLIVLSAVHPFPGTTGQQQRVKNKLLAFQDRFRTTFLTTAPQGEIGDVSSRLRDFCDDSIVLPSLYRRSAPHRIGHLAGSIAYSAATGLKRSNYVVGKIELSAERVAGAIGEQRFDLALFEYWHASASISPLRDAGARCILDMHDVLWRAYERQLRAKRWLPPVVRRALVGRYRSRELLAWHGYDALIAINDEERRYVSGIVDTGARLFFAPMGVDLDIWKYSWNPAEPPRVGFYGSLASSHNQRDALGCHEQIMPAVLPEIPDAELWIVGDAPPPPLKSLGRKHQNVTVTGYVDDPSKVLRSLTVAVCPWSGRYGFRSRIVELMALGLPVVATSEAVDGMDLRPGSDLIIADSHGEMASAVLQVMKDRDLAVGLSRSARARAEELYSFDATYGRLARDLDGWIRGPVDSFNPQSIQ
jgi:glycosyltransferase involved in cell wall biosynthesis